MITSMARTFSNINADEEFNFWTQHNQIIVSTDALKPLEKRQGWSEERVNEYNKYRMEAVLDADFDLVIIDEAHKMGGGSSTVSRYILAQELCNSVENVLLLTATPHRGKSDHFRRILQLLDPDAFAGEGLPDIEELEPYVIRTEKRLAVDYDGNKLFNERITNRFDVFLDEHKHAKQIELYLAVTEYVRKGFNAAKKKKNTAIGLIMVLFQRLASSSTAAILSAMEGRLERLRNGEYDDGTLYDEEISSLEELEELIDFDGFIQNDKSSLVDEESVLAGLIAKAKECIETEQDAKSDALIEKFNQLQQEASDNDLKILIFTEFRTTQNMLKTVFEKKGYRCETINGSQDIDERKRALVAFKNESQILIATDAAGESLNMQFCHIIVNYDLPWNPMMIEQRIGRVDRIGQKHKVQAFNMLTNNSVDLRVYEVIEEKLNTIIEQLGIDKTSDVLDSAIDLKQINKLYLQSLLDPDKFEFAGDKWLHQIRSKLRDFESTEGILPGVNEDEIDAKKAAEIKYSPLPQYLEGLIEEHTKLHEGSLSKSLLGYTDINIDGEKRRITFDSEVSLNNPDVEHLTLQSDWIVQLLNDIGSFESSEQLPVLTSRTGEETSGIWSLWQITAKNQFEKKTAYQCYFVSDKGKQFTAYANDLWNRFVSGEADFKLSHEYVEDIDMARKVLDEALFTTFQNLEASVQDKMAFKKENKINSYEYQKTRISKIGIENIKQSKLQRLERDHEKWLREFNSNQKIIPSIQQLLTIKING
jgi:SNF2 family DNA or RNA helicase